MSDALTVTIDGVEIAARAGQMVIQATDEAGVYVPRLCHHPDLHPFGACRVCTVMINGRPQAACTTPVTGGMVIENDTPRMLAFRRDLIDMLFVEGNHYCMFCEKSGLCELQALAYRFGITAPQFPLLNPDRAIDLSHPDVYLDHNRCILCGRCVRVSQELDNKNVFQFIARGHKKRLQVNGEALAGTSLEVADQVTASCPVGALMRKRVGYAVPVGQRPFDREAISVAWYEERKF